MDRTPTGTYNSSFRLGRLELVCIFVVLLVAAGGFLQFLQGNANLNTARTGSWPTNALWITSYVLAIAAFLRNPLDWGAIRKCWPMFLPVGATSLSFFWSEVPSLTFLRTSALWGTTLFGLYLGMRLTLRDQSSVLSYVFGAAAALSLLFGLFLPDVGVGTGEFAGDWRGIFDHKNGLGLNMALAFGLFIVLYKTKPERRIQFTAWAILCLALVLLSRSATALICSAAEIVTVFLGAPLLRSWTRLTFFKRTALVLTVVLIVTLLYTQHDSLLEILDRDPNLTGRTEMWTLVGAMILQKPFLGYGYGGFWRGYSGPSGEIWEALGTEFFYSHNGLLDVWLDIGILGPIFVLLAYAVALRRAFVLVSTTSSSLSLWPLVFLVFLLVSNLSEGSFLRGNVLPTIVFTALYYRLALLSTLQQRAT